MLRHSENGSITAIIRSNNTVSSRAAGMSSAYSISMARSSASLRMRAEISTQGFRKN
ncbi:Uncharacterised protein [Mycobacteroides abscessus subsp. abscessus]|nr:Uncharacterised protein [Mycobacteroides abscessus subsp. abscessus]